MPRALVTGSAGFVGRAMTRELVERGWSVTGWDIRGGNGYTLDAVEMFTQPGAFAEKQPIAGRDYDLLVHCAYHVGGRAAIDGKNTNLAKNLQLDAAMFDYAVRSGRVGHVLYFSSSAVYPVGYQMGGPWGKRLSEVMAHTDGPLIGQPDADYGWAKMNGERLAEMARASGVAVSVVRPFSGYGWNQSNDYPFPSIVRRAMDGDLSVWGPPGQTRDWIHITDVVRGALAVAEKQAYRLRNGDVIPLAGSAEEPVNLCTGVGTTMGELAMMVRRQLEGREPHDGHPENHVTYDETKPTGVLYRVGDPTRMLGYYKPTITLEQGIEEAIRHARMA